MRAQLHERWSHSLDQAANLGIFSSFLLQMLVRLTWALGMTVRPVKNAMTRSPTSCFMSDSEVDFDH